MGICAASDERLAGCRGSRRPPATFFWVAYGLLGGRGWSVARQRRVVRDPPRGPRGRAYREFGRGFRGHRGSATDEHRRLSRDRFACEAHTPHAGVGGDAVE